MNNSVLKFIYILFISLWFVSCENNEEPEINPFEGLTKLKEGYASGAAAKVEIWGKKNFFAGYNNLVVALYDSVKPTEKITDAHIHFMPVMTMGMGGMTMQHACPYENPDETAIDDVFPGAVVFVMPTSMDGSWKLDLSVHNHKNDKEGKITFDISVDNPTPSVINVFTALAPDNNKLVLSMLEPSKPKVGINDIEFTLHKKATMMDWPADDSYTIEITPEMPSMGHGSPNNVNPVSTGNGHYKGKVNFTMTGEWKINVVVKKNGTAVSNNLYFTITL